MTGRVTLRPMDEAELAAYVARGGADYVDQLVELGGRKRDAAEAKAASDYATYFPNGRPAAGHHLYVAEVDGEPVGRLWIAEHGPGWDEGTAYVFDVEVVAEHRGRGYGRAIMRAGEAVARSLGARQLALNVFGGNTAAITLYTSLGYEVTAQQMRKVLGAEEPAGE